MSLKKFINKNPDTAYVDWSETSMRIFQALYEYAYDQGEQNKVKRKEVLEEVAEAILPSLTREPFKLIPDEAMELRTKFKEEAADHKAAEPSFSSFLE